MSDLVTVAIIGAIQALGLAWLNRKSNQRETRTGNKIDAVHRDVNGQTQALLDVTGQSERAKGNLEGRAQERAESGT